jgi:16S rRNA processing protein RimM
MPSSSSKAESGRRTPPEQVLVGTVLRPHGVRGAVVVEVSSDVPDRFAPGSELTATPRAGAVRSLVVETGAPHGRSFRVRFEGVATREQAEQLRGASLTVPGAAVPEAPGGSYYVFELAGCHCFDRRAGELGTVADVVADGGGWLVVVERPDGSRLPLPFVERYVVTVDRGRSRIEWDLPEGLIETCASRS